MSILVPIIVLGSLGAIFGLWLIFAQKIFAVHTDPRIEHIFALLPGSNCGACGKAGCFGLAEALAKGAVETISCPSAEQETKEEISELLGIKFSQAVKQIATLICGGGAVCKDKFQYQGPSDCNIATLLMGGHKACNYACIGFGSCVTVCPFDAIHMGEDELPVIDIERCTGCGKCIKVCPKEVLVLTPIDKHYHVICHSSDRGPDVMKACKVGCTGCGKCVKECPVSAIDLKDFLAVIDCEKCTNCGACIEVCPTEAIGGRDTETGKIFKPEKKGVRGGV